MMFLRPGFQVQPDDPFLSLVLGIVSLSRKIDGVSPVLEEAGPFDQEDDRRALLRQALVDGILGMISLNHLFHRTLEGASPNAINTSHPETPTREQRALFPRDLLR